MLAVTLTILIGATSLLSLPLEARRKIYHSGVTRLTDRSVKLVHGDDRFPFNQVVSINDDGSGHCSGIIVKNGKVLTLPGCAVFSDVYKLSVTHGLLKPGNDLAVKFYKCTKVCRLIGHSVSILDCDLPEEFKEMCFAKTEMTKDGYYTRAGVGLTNGGKNIELTYDDKVHAADCADYPYKEVADFCYSSRSITTACWLDQGGPIFDSNNCLVGLIRTYELNCSINVYEPELIEGATSLVNLNVFDLPPENFTCAE